MPSGTLTADAVISAHHITADAWILGTRWQHHRVRDHFGAESDLYVVLSEDVGPYVAFTPIHFVLADLIDRIISLETATKRRAFVTADAFLALSGTYGRGIFTADAIIESPGGGSFTADAVIQCGGTITADAVIMPRLTADAYIVLAT